MQTTVSMAYPAGDLALLAGRRSRLASSLEPQGSPPGPSAHCGGTGDVRCRGPRLQRLLSPPRRSRFRRPDRRAVAIAAPGLVPALAVLAHGRRRGPRRGKGGTPAREIMQKRVSLVLPLQQERWQPRPRSCRGDRKRPGLSLVLGVSALALLIAIGQYVTQRHTRSTCRGFCRKPTIGWPSSPAGDSLTSVPNRRSIEVVLADEFQRAQRHGREVSVCFVDIDHFKTVDPPLGRRRWRSCPGPSPPMSWKPAADWLDITSRWVGEESQSSCLKPGARRRGDRGAHSKPCRRPRASPSGERVRA